MAVMKFNIYKLHFISPVHLGDVRDDYGISLKTMASDTMYAALTACLAKLGKPVPEDGDLGCTISSLFPFYQAEKGSECVLFFPKPLKQILPSSEIAMTERKKIKKVVWLDANYFSKTLRGEQLFDESTISNAIQGVYLTNKSIDKDFVMSQVVPRVVVSRTGEDAVPFYMDRVSFKGYSGLYFMVEGDLSRLDEAMRLLQQEGVGTDCNVGNGCFEYETAIVEIDIPENSEYAMALSSFIPETKEQLKTMLDDNVAYDFQRRGGWITTPPFNTIRKDVVYAFTAGSVFCHKSSNDYIKGRMVDLCPKGANVNHPIWRCGRSLFVPIKICRHGRN